MPLTNLHCVNVIEPRRPGCRTHSVRLVLVSAGSEIEAIRKVALSLSEYDGDCRVKYRNAFNEADDPDTLTWSYQTWSREDANVGGLARDIRAIAERPAPTPLDALRQAQALLAKGTQLGGSAEDWKQYRETCNAVDAALAAATGEA